VRAHSQRFAFGPGITLSIGGKESVVHHFEHEYGSVAASAAPVSDDVAVGFERDVEAADHEVTLNGRHKTVRWRVALGNPNEQPLRARIAVMGRPLSFGLSLVQGYFVEPLLAIAAARRGHVLLPGAGIQQDGGVVVLMARSRSGKSALSARALASGKVVLGDDQVFADSRACCWAFPRRVRVYSDFAKTAPAAYARLPPLTRTAIASRRVVSRLTRGYVAPPIRVPFSALGEQAVRTALPIVRVVVIERSSMVDAVQSSTMEIESALLHALDLLDAQRAHVRTTTDAAWREALRETREEEASILRDAFARIPLAHLAIPERWGAALAVSRLADLLATER
jgi:hypothetical protein